MKTLGLIGGMSWLSSAEYYKILNESINARLGGLSFARCILYSLNYDDIRKFNETQDWDGVLKFMIQVSRTLVSAGAEGLLLCANTMHIVADELQKNIDIPLIHIAEATAATISGKHLHNVGLLGTKFTMEEDFFKKKLSDKNISTIIPPEADREFIHRSIFEELGRNIFKESTKKRYIEILDNLASQGCEGVILGCTEIPLLLKQQDHHLPLFDTTKIHAEAGVAFALGA